MHLSFQGDPIGTQQLSHMEPLTPVSLEDGKPWLSSGVIKLFKKMQAIHQVWLHHKNQKNHKYKNKTALISHNNAKYSHSQHDQLPYLSVDLRNKIH